VIFFAPQIILVTEKLYMTFTREKEIEKLFREHYRPQVAFAFGYLEDMEEARDVVQDVYTALFAKDLSNIENKKSYLYMAVKNGCIDRLNKRKTQQKYLDTVANEFPETEENRLLQAEREAWLLESIEKLPEKRREVFKLSRFEKKKYNEIAEILGISPRTVEVQIRQALHTLREWARTE